MFLCLFTWAAGAQHNHTRCGNDDVLEEIKSQPDLYKKYMEGRALQFKLAQELPLKKSSEQLYIIPVVYHVIYWDSTDNISEAQLRDGLEVMNTDFRRMNADTVNTRPLFRHLGADVRVEFRLATKDPDGNPTNGIDRVKDHITINAGASVRVINQWPHEHYFNIWVVRKIDDSGKEPGVTTLGYSFIPFPGQTGDYDGMVVRHDQVGRIGTAANSGQRGRTMTHEAGHYCGLNHTFEGGCDTIYWSGDDGIDDTPPAAGPNYVCDYSINSCHADTLNDLPDMIENYMDYAPGTCMNIFTQGQKQLMRASFESANLRAMLVRQSNLERTGVLSAEELVSTSFGLYPNPAKDRVILESAESLQGAIVSLSDLSGREIAHWSIEENSTRFEMELGGKNLIKGVYLVSLKRANGVRSSFEKLVIE